jgi:hypothetical protein
MRAAPWLRKWGTLALGTLLLCGCATPAASDGDPTGTTAPLPVAGELHGQGMVRQKGAEPPQLCLGAIMESYPPQCTGPALTNWDWSKVDDEEAASGVTWGSYLVTGTWDGVQFTQTKDPIPLSLYDPAPPASPAPWEGTPGLGSEAQLELIQAEIFSSHESSLLGSRTTNGYLILNVFYDDGALQNEMDAKYGPKLVLVESALRPVSR